MRKSKKQKTEDRAYALAYFRAYFPTGSTLYTVVMAVGRSGMTRTVKLVGMRDGVPFDLSLLAADALDWPMARDGSGVRVSGAGMDMGFHLVGCLGRAAWPQYDPPKDDRGIVQPYPYTHRWL